VVLVVKNPPAKAGGIRDLGSIPRCEEASVMKAEEEEE